MYDNLISKAQELRQKTFLAFAEHGEAHLGGSFSIIEMLLALYESVLKEGDKFILSKAHELVAISPRGEVRSACQR